MDKISTRSASGPHARSVGRGPTEASDTKGHRRRSIGTAPAPDVASRTILVVDDRPDTVAATQCALELAGHQVEVAYDREGAIQKAFELRPEVILCDIELPGRHDGHVVAETLRASPWFEKTYMIAITGLAEPEDVKEAVAAGFDLHVAKPVDAQLLLRLIAERFEGMSV